MLQHLIHLADRAEADEKLLPVGYKQFSQNIQWVIEVHPDGTVTRRKDADLSIPRPDRQRSGKPSETNLKPYLLVDEARYALGIAEEGKEEEAELLHKGFRELISEAAEATGDRELQQISNALENSPLPPSALVGIEPRDTVMLAGPSQPYPVQRESVRAFWSSYLSDAFLSDHVGACTGCGSEAPLLQTIPQKVTVFGETCQLTSFNNSAFESYGKKQTLNAPLCYRCGSRATAALQYLAKSETNRLTIARSSTSGTTSLQDQMALFWLKADPVAVEVDGDPYDPEQLLAQPLFGATDEDEGRPTMGELEQFLKVPWNADASGLRADDAAFNLLIISANRSRLVVREWMNVPLDRLRENLATFLSSQRIVSAWGDVPQPFGIRQLLDALAVKSVDIGSRRPQARGEVDPNLVRGLVRTAYHGDAPPAGLLPNLARTLRNPKIWHAGWCTHRLMALAKLALTFQQENNMTAQQLETLDPQSADPPYLCGRLLAVLEEAQNRASGWNLNATLVDRYYPGASTAPASTFGRLINVAETAHLPKIRKERWGYKRMSEAMGEVLSALDEAGGFPRTLTLEQQARFALGFYHQRANFRRERQARKEQNSSEE